MKKKPIGPRPPQAAVEKRRGEVLEHLAAGKDAQAIAKAVNAPYGNVKNDLAQLRKQFASSNQEGFAKFVAAQVELLVKQYEATYHGQLPPDVSNACTGILRSIAKLTGSDAPVRSISASVRVDDPEKLVGYRRFCLETRWVHPEDFEQIWHFVRRLSSPPAAQPVGLLVEGDGDESD